MDKISRDFFWKKFDNIKSQPMVPWDKTCHPKKLGGLGLRKMEAINNAFLCKLM